MSLFLSHQQQYTTSAVSFTHTHSRVHAHTNRRQQHACAAPAPQSTALNHRRQESIPRAVIFGDDGM